MKRIMILGASILQLPAIRKAKEMGLQVVAVDMNPNAIGFSEDGVIKEVISTIDVPAVVDAANRNRVDGVMTLASDMPMRAVAAVAKEMNLVGISEETAVKATDKGEMRATLLKHGVPIPTFYRVNSREEYYSAVERIKAAGYRCIVKPADNSGSRGIDLLSDFENETIDKAYDYSKKSSRSGDLMVEEYMDGDEVSVESLSIDGVRHIIQITDKLTTGAPFFVEMGHSQPSALPDEVKEKIRQITVDANRAIGIENGPAHTEIKITKDGPKIIELGARLGGDNITTHLTPLSTGVDMVECCINIAMGNTADVEQKFNKGSAIRYFPLESGVIKSIDGIDRAENVSGVTQVSIVHGVGEKIDGIRSSGDRVGFVIAQGENENDAVRAAEEGISKVKFEVE